MKHLAILSLSVIFLLLSCNKDNNNETPANDFRNFNSQICTNVTGVQALYWDYAHGLPVPLTQIPTLSNPGTQFIHTQYPGLGFTMPAGYSATEITIPQIQALGVNVVRNDNNVVWRYIPSLSLQGNVGVNDVLALEINNMFSVLGFNGSPQVVCTTNETGIIAGTFPSAFGARLLRFGNFTALVWARTMVDTTLNVTFTSISVSVAPTAEFDAVVFETFLPISFQLLFIDNDVRDSDLDGFPDNQDNFPFDPTRH